MKNILVVFTGGTFSMRIDEKTGAAVPCLNGDDLLKLIPGAKGLANLSTYDFGMYPGPHMTPELMLELSKKVQEFVDKDDIDAVIVTHGTDTLEETSYLVDLTVKTEKPVVFIGAMKTSSDEDWDGPRNLIDALYVCNNENSKGLGVLVVLDGEINAASEVTKTHTEKVETFSSLDFGSMGFVDRGRVFFNRAPRKLELIQTENLNSNVDLIKVYAGMDDKFFKLSVDSGVEGLVVEAMGVGNVPPKAFDGIKYARERGIPVILTSRCPAGEITDAYGYPGAGKWLRNIGVKSADYLNGQKARIKLILALGLTSDIDELAKLFDDE